MTCYQLLGPQGFGVYEVEWTASGPKVGELTTGDAPILVPGFVDQHIHGGCGVDFMSASSAEIGDWADHMATLGYEAFLPTTITASADEVLAALSRLPDHPLIRGFHLEGPFISPKHPGAQPVERIGAPNAWRSPAWMKVLEDPRLKVITMAPEVEGGCDLAAMLRARGVTVSMGHTDATYAEASAGFRAGVNAATHTYNAMRGLHHREAGALGFAMFEDGIACELIYDRIHVTTEAAAILLRMKPSDKVMAISDGTLAAGLPPGTKVDMWGHAGVVGERDVRLVSNGVLAGSTITLRDAFANLFEDFGAETAIRSCCLNPRVTLGLSGSPLVWLVFDEKLDLLSVKTPA